MANNLPTPESYEQILSDMLSSYASKIGVNDLNVGSAVTSFYEVVALMVARSSGDTLQILRDFSVDRASGDALKRLAAENNVTPLTARTATGYVTITDTSFSKIATKVYAGVNPPNIGSMQVPVSDASLFPASGNIYIGRGTNNVEGPLAYSSITPVGGFFVLNLNAPTAKFHNVGEAVILAQGGNRSINLNSSVLSPAVGASPDIRFSTTAAAVILDGETTVSGVPVSAATPGAASNVPSGAIRQFSSNPPSIPAASVTNPLPFTTGADSETDDQLKVRIKRALASTGLGTGTAIQSSVIGATPSDEAATIVSASILTGTNSATLFIDDGTGYEAKVAGVGLESIVDSALGGEQFFQLATGGSQAPVAKAFLRSTLSAPFDLIGTDTLSVVVGNTTYQHVFSTKDFRSPGGATAFEVTASINANTNLGFEATTSGGGQFVVLRSKTENNDSIQTSVPTTSGRDASVQMGLPSNQIQTLRLYKNNIPLSKDGNLAAIFSQAQTLWSSTIANGETLILAVDGTAPITFTINDGDFIATGLYTSVSANNTLASWATVLNAKLTGVTVGVVGQALEITSNLGASNRAKVVIDPASSLVAKGMFSALVGLSSQGSASDFILNRNTAQIELVVPLAAGDLLAAGSTQIQATVETTQNSGGSVSLSANGHIWLLIDAPGSIVPTALTGNSTLIVTKPSANIVQYTSTVTTAFTNVRAGDYLIIWSAELDPTLRLEGRVYSATGSTLQISVTASEWAAAVPTVGTIYSQGLVVLRSSSVPQKFTVTSGSSTLDAVANQLQMQTDELKFSVLSEQYILARTNTQDSTGSILIVTADAQGSLVGFQSGSSNTSKTSLIANYDSAGYDTALPLFVHAAFATGTAADPTSSYISSLVSSLSLSGRDPNELISFLQPYGSIPDAQPFGEYVQETSINNTAIGIAAQPRIRRVRVADRYFLANPLDFGNQDTAVVVLDNDTSNKSFEIPLYRRAITNTSNANNATTFNAYDVDSGSAANFSSAFGPSFDFSNYKALMRAKKTLKPSTPKTAILYRSTPWGRSGEKINIGYSYPAGPNTAIGSTVVVNTSVTILINLASGVPISTSIDGSTEWNVSITPNTPQAGTDQVTFSYSGLGSSPALTLSGGEYVNITKATEFAPGNDGTFRVSTQAGFSPTSTSFTVTMPSGVATAQTNKATQVANAITFYRATATTAAQVQAYVAANLQPYLSATLVMDTDTTGSGVIGLSTYEDSGFSSATVFLQDGINWIQNSSLVATPQFTFKKSLALPSDVGYSFNNGEEIRLVPTTMGQVARLASILAVTGFSTVGSISLVDRGTRIDLSTDVIGSGGAIQIIGGTANQYSVPVLDSATRLDNINSMISVDSVSGSGILSDQWFRLQAKNKQNKLTLIGSNTSVSIQSNTPSTSQSTISLLNKSLTQRYFGRPRHSVRILGNTFRVEKQGSLVCLSWNGIGSSPQFLKSSLNFNDASGGTLNVYTVLGGNDSIYQILSGAANFTELSINDKVTISGMANSANNGTFLVTGVSDDGTMLQVTNPNAVNQFSSSSFTFTGNSTAGDTFTVGTNSLVAGTNFAIGVNQAATAANLSALIGTLSGFTSSASGSVVTVTGMTPAQNSSIAYSGTAVVTVSHATLTGSAFAQGSFTAQSGVSEGDNVVITAPFAVLNQGKFRVIRRFNDSIWIENPNAIGEEVTTGANSVSLGFDSTTSLKVNATNSKIYLNWNGTGTEPLIGNAQMGDVVTFGTDFSSANQGAFMVTRSGAKLQQISQLTMPTGAQFSTSGTGTYFKVNSAGNVNQYYVWFNVNSGNTDPTPFGLTGVPVAILSSDSAAQIASKVVSALIGGSSGLSISSTGAVVTVTTNEFIETNDPVNVSVPAPFAVVIVQEGRRAFLECLNPSAVNQSVVFVTNVLSCNRPQMVFSPYDSTVAGDKIVISGSALTSSNAGTYTVIKVLSRDTAIVSGTLAPVTNISLNGSTTAISVLEDAPYVGYKHVLLASAQPSAPTRSSIVFDTNAQYAKINEAAGVELASLSKLNFPTTVSKGLDSYSYNTGLIAEANRIIYGDPRDSITYPGTGAAGADIFVREPLTLRVSIAIDVRLATGAPFPTVAQSVRTTVAALINSNPVGQSIDISSLIAAARSVGGVLSVAIDSPLFSSSNDLIPLSPGQKARIIDPSTDISVSQLGS
jgi:uncharacterized phage protein gp47/JayE